MAHNTLLEQTGNEFEEGVYVCIYALMCACVHMEACMLLPVGLLCHNTIQQSINKLASKGAATAKLGAAKYRFMCQLLAYCLYVLHLEHWRATINTMLMAVHMAIIYYNGIYSWRIQPVADQLLKINPHFEFHSHPWNIELFHIHKNCGLSALFQ